jgi:hypothetical protein
MKGIYHIDTFAAFQEHLHRWLCCAKIVSRAVPARFLRRVVHAEGSAKLQQGPRCEVRANLHAPELVEATFAAFFATVVCLDGLRQVLGSMLGPFDNIYSPTSNQADKSLLPFSHKRDAKRDLFCLETPSPPSALSFMKYGWCGDLLKRHSDVVWDPGR